MPNLTKFMIAVALIALASTTPMFAAVTHSGAAQKAIVVVTETNDQFTSSTSYSDLVGAAAVITVLAAITVVIFLTLLALLAAGPIMRLIGERLEAMITRILGVILAALAAQFIVDGIKQSFPSLLA